MTQRTKSQSLKALRGVRNLVLEGHVRPGERLSEVAVAERLGISRTPLRAALSRLEQEGLLELIPTGGYAVRSFTLDQVFDSIELRGVLEGTAARLAAERGVESSKLDAMKTLIVELDSTVSGGFENIDIDRYAELNAEFHTELAGLSGSDIIRREIERATKLPFASPAAFLEHKDSIPEFRKSLIGGQHQHKMIVNAIEMREGARAEALAREHARLARQNLEFIIKGDRSLLRQVPSLVLVSEQ